MPSMAMFVAASIFRKVIIMFSIMRSMIWSFPRVIRAGNRYNMLLLAGGFGDRRSNNAAAMNSIQKIYDSLSSITLLEESLQSPNDCPFIKDCLNAMDELTLSELGLDLDYVRNVKDSVCMNIVSSNEFDMSVFIIPKGRQLPLHDHPSMVVLSKVIVGELNVRCFSPENLNWRGHTSAGKASLISSSMRTSNNAAWMLTPVLGNVHELKADETTIVFDVLMPPYLEPERPCNFYRSVKDENGWALENISPPPNRLLPSVVPYNGLRPNVKESAWGSMFRWSRSSTE